MHSLRLSLPVLAVAVILSGGSAHAACTDDLKIVKEEFKNVRNVRKRDLLKREISAADSALKHKSETNCKRAVMNAQRILKQKP